MIAAIFPLIEELSKDYNHNIFIAGGAVRDLICNKQMNDIDLYILLNDVQVSENKYAANLVTNFFKLKKAGNTITIKNESKINKYPIKDSIYTKKIVFNTNIVDLIYISGCVYGYSIEKYIHSVYDVGLCEAYTGLDGVLRASHRFLHDFKNKLISCYIKPSMLNPDNPYSVHKTFTNHVPRLREKFKDFGTCLNYTEMDNLCMNQFYKINQGGEII